MFQAPLVVAVRKGTRKRGREASLAKEKRFRYPVVAEMIAALREMFWCSEDGAVKMTYLAIAFASTFALRNCAYAWNAALKGEHCILNCDVRCWLHSGEEIDINDLKVENQVAALWFINRSNKTDNKGIGARYILSRSNPVDSQLLDDMVDFISWRGQPCHEEDIFFSLRRNGRLKRLTYSMLSKMIKALAEPFQLDPAHLQTYGLRIGGATAVDFAGHDNSVLEAVGSWSAGSSSARKYPEFPKANVSTNELVKNKPVVSVEQIQRLKPRSRKQKS
jgi:hypothetical protein